MIYTVLVDRFNRHVQLLSDEGLLHVLVNDTREKNNLPTTHKVAHTPRFGVHITRTYPMVM